MIEPEVVIDKLSQFETANELALFFQEEGITGVPSVASHCPIAQYIKRHCDVPHGVNVGGQRIQIFDEWSIKVAEVVGPDAALKQPFRGRSYYNTPAMQEFIQMFDRGSYPQLTNHSAEVLERTFGK